MMNKDGMNTRIELQRSTSTANEYGEASDIVWTTYASRWSSIETTGSAELVEAQQVKSQSTHNFKLRYLSGVLSSDRIKWGDRVFQIDGIVNENESNRWLVITTKER